MALRECQNLEATVAIVAREKEDAEATCSDLAQVVNELQTEVYRNEDSMVASVRRMQGLEATVATLTQFGEDQAARLQGVFPFVLLLIHRLFSSWAPLG